MFIQSHYRYTVIIGGPIKFSKSVCNKKIIMVISDSIECTNSIILHSKLNNFICKTAPKYQIYQVGFKKRIEICSFIKPLEINGYQFHVTHM